MEEAEVDEFVNYYKKNICKLEAMDQVGKYKPQVPKHQGWQQGATRLEGLSGLTDARLRRAQERLRAKRQDARRVQSEFANVGWWCVVCTTLPGLI